MCDENCELTDSGHKCRQVPTVVVGGSSLRQLPYAAFRKLQGLGLKRESDAQHELSSSLLVVELGVEIRSHFRVLECDGDRSSWPCGRP